MVRNWFHEKRVVLYARELANQVPLADETAQKAQSIQEESRVVLYNAFTTLVGDYSRQYTDVVSARDELSDAEDRARFLHMRS